MLNGEIRITQGFLIIVSWTSYIVPSGEYMS